MNFDSFGINSKNECNFCFLRAQGNIMNKKMPQ